MYPGTMHRGKAGFPERLQTSRSVWSLFEKSWNRIPERAKRVRNRRDQNRTAGSILLNTLMVAASLFVNGFGVYLTIQANLGAAPWDVLNLGLSRSLGILYGTASIAVSCTILGIDILLKEPVGIAMFIDAFVVGIGFGLSSTRWETLVTVLVIFVVTFVVSVVGVFLGKRNIPVHEKAATVLAGIVLIALGTYTLLQHTLL